MFYGHIDGLIKQPIDATPLNLVFGIDALLPIEFLIPTLRIAQELKWTCHDLSDRIEDLEQLDETWLKVIEGMYVEKCYQKRWHNQNLHTKEFHKGKLVLAYTLKQHKCKLKLRGLSPFLIYDISPSGLV